LGLLQAVGAAEQAELADVLRVFDHPNLRAEQARP
jgi:hypothetical protein